MRARLTVRWKTAAILAGALAFCAPVRSDVSAFDGASSARKMCYCNCDSRPGAAICTHMCELPKYEDRSWANNCHTNPEGNSLKPFATPRAHSEKDDGIQDVRR
jgi:hypothetical protein